MEHLVVTTRAFACGLAGILFATALSAQTPPTDLARQHLESGIQFYEQQRYKQALNDFQIIVSSMADTEFADDALLRIGRYYLEVEEDFEKAKESFETAMRNYPTGDAAPGAYYYLGEVILRSHRGGAGVDDALANFQRVFLYENNPWIPAALYTTGVALERQGKFQEAVDSYFQVVVEHPGSEWTAGAQLAVGRSSVRLGNPMEAMTELQQVRNLYPDSAEAEEALDWLTLLYRFYGGPSLGQPVRYRRDVAFMAQLRDKFKDVKTLRISISGIHVLERGRKRVLTFDRDGKLAGTIGSADPYDMFIDPRGGVIVTNSKGLTIGGQPAVFAVPGDEKGPKQLEKIRVAVRDRLAEVYLYDEKQKQILRFDAAGKLLGPFPDSNRREVLRMEIDRNGNILVLDKKDRDVVVFSPSGRTIARLKKNGSSWSFKKPVDIALDPAGYLYLLDQDQAQVAVFDGSYNFVTLLNTQSLGGGVLQKPVTLDVDASGDLYVYDDKEKAIIRLH